MESNNANNKGEKQPLQPKDECITLEAFQAGAAEQRQETGKTKAPINNIEPLPIHNRMVLSALDQNEDGDAYIYQDLFRGQLIFDCNQGEWYRWEKHFWKQDAKGEHFEKIKDVIALYQSQQECDQKHLDLANMKQDEKTASFHEARIKRLRERITQLHTLFRKRNVLSLSAKGKNSLAYDENKWDDNPMLLPCINGTINLETGEFFGGRQSDMITKYSPIPWKGADEPCDLWKEFLASSLGNDMELVGFMHRLMGYGITGRIDEHLYPILWGENGRNGKSTILEIMKYILGDLAYKLPATYFTTSHIQKAPGAADAETMALMGRRLVWGSETNKKDQLNVSKIKELVGGDTLSARAPYAKKQIEFLPTYLLFLLTNKRPKAPADDQALWERIVLIPFLYSFVKYPDPNNPYQRPQIENLKEKLQKEASGILAWLVQGCLWWQRDGLKPPDSIMAATQEYRTSEDIIGLFITEMCFVGKEDDKVCRVTAQKLYQVYKAWCEEVGHHAMAKKHFIEEMKTKHPYKKDSEWTFRGITTVD